MAQNTYPVYFPVVIDGSKSLFSAIMSRDHILIHMADPMSNAKE